MTTPALAKVNTFPAHYTQVYVVTVVSVGNGICTVDPGDGGTLTEVPYYGTPMVGTTCPMVLFDGQLAVLGLARQSYANPALAPASGWSVTFSSAAWDGAFCQVYFNITRTGAQIPAASRGNITNSLAATLLAGVPAPAQLTGMAVVGGAMLIGGALTTDRLLNVSFAPPGQPINTGDGFNGSFTYAT